MAPRSALGPDVLGQPEVDELDVQAGLEDPREHDVVGLDVEVDDVPVVQVLQRLQHLADHDDTLGLGEVELGHGDGLEEVPAGQALHKDAALVHPLVVGNIAHLGGVRLNQVG